MHVGVSVLSQNMDNRRTDREVLGEQVRLADVAADLGFDSIWGTEHHFTGYIIAPDVLQFLTFVAGRHPHMGVGAQVVVIPWHNPLRVVEQVALLDHFCGGKLILGIGRGAARVEFEGFGLDMNESRERFVEYADMIVKGLETGSCEYDGKYLKQRKVDIRPRPFQSFRRRTFAAAVSPDSAPIMAKLGCGLLVIPQKPWDMVADDMVLHRRAYREAHAEEAPAPVCGGFVYCDANAGRAKEMVYTHMVEYWRTVLHHYEYGGDHFARTKGYESYGNWAKAIQEQGAQSFAENFVSLQPWGTPDQVYDKLVKIRKQIGFDTLAQNFCYGGMSVEDGERSLTLFAKEVLPALKKLPAPDFSAEAA